MRIKLLAAAASVFLLARVFAGSQEAPRPAQVEWLMANAIPFETAEAGTGFADLEPLRAIIGDARIVALGEGTHGTREFFRMKHRLTEFLASEMGFTIFSIEASTPEAFAVSD
jgi:erythromycin esterase